MAVIIRMPEVLANTSEAAIQTWLVAVGEAVAVGTPLAEVETEKAVVEYAAEVEGTLLKLLVVEGTSVQVGEPIAVVGAAGESFDDLLAPGGFSDGEAVQQVAPEPSDEVSIVAGSPLVPERRFISPLVRRLAKERGLDLSAVLGTGPGGRIVRRDIEGLTAPVAVSQPAAAPSAPVDAVQAEGGVDIPHTAMRRAIARRLTESKSTVPHFYLVSDCRVDALVALRESVNQTASVKISLNDFVIKAAAGAFQDVPEANATWGEQAIRRHATVDISVAVAIEGGLVTPVLRSVENSPLGEISRSVAELVGRAREGKLRQHELEGGSFSISNLGMYGVTEFSAIINPPQSAILAVGRARQQPIVVEGQIEVGTVMTVTLSADHRVLDGALAAQWLAAFTRRIENPFSILI